MTSIEFGKKCQPLNKQYRNLFGYVPCRGDYICSQDEYFEALKNSIETKQEISNIIKKRCVTGKDNNRRD